MSNEINVQLNLIVQNPSTGGGFKQNIQQTGQYTQNAQGECGDVQSIPTTVTNLSTSVLTTMGWAYFQNLDATNYITIGINQSGTLAGFVKLKAGEFCALRLVDRH